jgi:RNA recognition motif-containing protein
MAFIYVGNIDRRSTEANVRSVFEMYGPVANVNIMPGFAVVEVIDEQQAQDAISALSEKDSWVLRTLAAA